MGSYPDYILVIAGTRVNSSAVPAGWDNFRHKCSVPSNLDDLFDANKCVVVAIDRMSKIGPYSEQKTIIAVIMVKGKLTNHIA